MKIIAILIMETYVSQRDTTFDLIMNMMVDEDTLVCIGLFEMYNDIMTLAKRETDQEIRD